MTPVQAALCAFSSFEPVLCTRSVRMPSPTLMTWSPSPMNSLPEAWALDAAQTPQGRQPREGRRECLRASTGLMLLRGHLLCRWDLSLGSPL